MSSKDRVLLGFTAYCTNKRKLGLVTIHQRGKEAFDDKPLFQLYVAPEEVFTMTLPIPITVPVVFRTRGAKVIQRHYAT